jgi:putative ATPase
MRPRQFEDLVGQTSVMGSDGFLRRLIEAGEEKLPSIILWGPPGVGKTTIARMMANTVRGSFVQLSAVDSGVARVKQEMEKAEKMRQFGHRTLLFVGV